MTPSLRVFMSAAALSAAGAVIAAGGPPTNEVDLGAMKLKRSNVPATAPTNAPAPTTTLPAVQKTTLLPAGPAAPAPAAAPAAATNNQANNAPTTGIGNVVQTPLKNRTADIINQVSNNKPDDKQQQQQSNDVQVKMPTLFRRP